MRIVRFLDPASEPRAGQELSPGRAELLPRGWKPGDALESTGQVVGFDRLLPPVEPVNIFCIGLNYKDHAAETGATLPEHPVVFMKPTTTVIGPNDAVVVPKACDRGDELDLEAELAVVIGKPGGDIAAADALDHVAGYTVANDISARKWQKHGGGGQWIRGKSFDTFCPLGPALVTADAIPDPQTLQVTSSINGEPLQAGHTGDMIFSVAELIAFLSRDTTLAAGTLILTGTPAGVGFVQSPPRFIKPSDTITVAVEGLGELTNEVVG